MTASPTSSTPSSGSGTTTSTSLRTDVARHRIDCELEATGELSVATEPHQVGWLREAADLGEGEFLDREAVRQQVASPTYLAGLWDRSGTVMVHPTKLAWGLADACERLGVRIAEQSLVRGIERDGSDVVLSTRHARVSASQVALGTNVFPSLLRRVRPYVVPVYDYAVVTEPLTDTQLAEIGWTGRQGIGDSGDQFHYYRLTADNRILFGGYDAIYHFGRRIAPELDQRPATFELLARHFSATFPQLDRIRFTHTWGGAIDLCSRFCAFFGTAYDGRVAYATGYTGLGVGASRFGAQVMLDLLGGVETERTATAMVRSKPVPFPLSRWPGSASRPPAGPSRQPTATRDGATSGFARWTGSDWASTRDRQGDGVMVMTKVDAVVVGGGAMGSAAAWQLARRGRSVVLLERFAAGHDRGASHGATRNFNVAYADDTYADLVAEARRLWDALAAETGEALLDLVGLVNHGRTDDFAAIERAVTSRGLRSETLRPEAAAERWTGMRFRSPVLHLEDAGRVRAAAALRALRTAAERHGADFRYEERVSAIELVDEDRVSVHTDSDTVTADCAVVTAGAWTDRLIGDQVRLPRLRVTQEQPAHFAILDRGAVWPSFNHSPEPDHPADSYWLSKTYGMESPGEGVKAGWHGTGPVTDPDRRSFRPDPEQLLALRRYVREWLPGADPDSYEPISCTYTSTVTEDFVLDRVGPLVVGAGFSGHGFKFTPAVGRVLADLATGGTAPEMFRADLSLR